MIQSYPHGYSTHYFYGGKNHNRKYKLSNAAKVIFLEYGTSREPARPFITKATNSAKEEVLRKMQEIYERKVGGN